MTWAWGLTDLDQSATLVLLALADAANDEGVAWPSQAEIGRKSRLQERAVRRQLAVLRDLGLISWESRATSRGRRSNLYLVHVGAQPERVSPDQSQPVAKTGWGAAPEGEPVDNLEMRRSEPTGHKDRLGPQPVTGDRCQPVTGDRLHIEEPNPHIESPDLTQPLPTPPSERGNDGRGGSGLDDRSEGGALGGDAAGAPTSGVSGAADELVEHVELVAECLPAPMQVLDAVGARQVVDLLAERVEAGWLPGQIRELLDQPLPPKVHRMAGLVASRLRDNVAVDQAPRRLEAAVARRRAERERQHFEALETQAETVDPVFEAVWERVKAEMPDAGYTVWAFEARERLKRYDLDAASSQ